MRIQVRERKSFGRGYGEMSEAELVGASLVVPWSTAMGNGINIDHRIRIPWDKLRHIVTRTVDRFIEYPLDFLDAYRIVDEEGNRIPDRLDFNYQWTQIMRRNRPMILDTVFLQTGIAHRDRAGVAANFRRTTMMYRIEPRDGGGYTMEYGTVGKAVFFRSLLTIMLEIADREFDTPMWATFKRWVFRGLVGAWAVYERGKSLGPDWGHPDPPGGDPPGRDPHPPDGPPPDPPGGDPGHPGGHPHHIQGRLREHRFFQTGAVTAGGWNSWLLNEIATGTSLTTRSGSYVRNSTVTVSYVIEPPSTTSASCTVWLIQDRLVGQSTTLDQAIMSPTPTVAGPLSFLLKSARRRYRILGVKRHFLTGTGTSTKSTTGVIDKMHRTLGFESHYATSPPSDYPNDNGIFVAFVSSAALTFSFHTQLVFYNRE
jgi:hypothetical protein